MICVLPYRPAGAHSVRSSPITASV